MAEANSTRRHPSFKDLTGKRFGKWTVIAEAVDYRSEGTYWLCRCTCGKEKTVQGCSLGNRSKGCQSCSQRQHGMCDTPEYGSWGAMKQRCNNPNMKAFPSYGGSGKVVCARWLESFDNFYADMGMKPSASHSIERIDGSQGYSCGHCEECVEKCWTANCKWATKGEQARNRQSNRLITFDGKTMCITDWSDKAGINVATLKGRLRRGWTIERALTTPVQQRRQE